MLILYITVLIFIINGSLSQDSEQSYKGRFIGNLNTYANQVSGEVHAVNDRTLLMVDFFYNGEGRDTYFWAGESGRSGPQGFIVPDEYGTTNILERYNGTNSFTLTLPDRKRISRLKWLAVFDIDTQNVYGDVYIPAGFEPPAPRTVGALAGSAAVSSEPVKFLNAKTFVIPEFRYDGSGTEVYFWTGVGPQPSPRGMKIPDEHGYLEPIRAYNGEDVQLEFPGTTTVFDVKWISIYDVGTNESLASTALPDESNVPAALVNVHPYKSTLPHCKQLHRNYQMSWEVFGNQITIQLAGQIGEREYMAFGISGSPTKSQMLGADVAVAWFDTAQQRGLATDYNVTDMAPCVQVLGLWRGVCRDDRLGGLDSNQVFSASRDGGLTLVTYRRTLAAAEEMDREYPLESPMFAIWAMGGLDRDNEPVFHYAYNKQDLRLTLGETQPTSDCFPFTTVSGSKSTISAWDTSFISDPAQRVFHFRLGAAGLRRGVAGRGARGGASPSLAWYVDGLMAPDLQLRRGLQYTFKVYGGNDPHSATEYHPLIITDEPVGGLERLGEAAQRARRVFAGVHHTRRGRLTPTAAGGLCVGRATRDRRRDDDFTSFRAYNRSLEWSCSGAPAELNVAPNSSWPDIVYYNSFTHAGMGGRISIVDRFRSARRGAGRGDGLAAAAFTVIILAAFGLLSTRDC